MVITKVREYLGVGLALLAAIAVGYGIITHLRLEAVQANLDTALTNNEVLTNTNKSNVEAIDKLIEQRQIDDKVLTMLSTEFDKLSKQSRLVKNSLHELANNDEEFKLLLERRHPPELIRLFNSRVGDGGEATDQDKATE